MITIVSGITCESKSFMMKVLEAGGLKIVHDYEHDSDCQNFRSCFEYEKINLIKSHPSRVYDKENIALKLMSFFLKSLPSDYNYNVILVERDLEEVNDNEKNFFNDFFELKNTIIMKDLIKKRFVESHINRIEEWLITKENFNVIRVDCRLLANNPVQTINKINKKLKLNLNIEKCISAVYPQLYVGQKVISSDA